MADLIVLEFLNTGLYTTIQDAGRSGWQEFGVPVSGAMDLVALNSANRLVGNEENGPCLEITMVGPRIRVHGKGNIALTGGNLSAMLNREPLPMYQTITVKNGDLISFGKCQFGYRAYLSVAGDWQVESWLGSASEVPYGGSINGLPKPIEKGREVLISCQRQISIRIEPPDTKIRDSKVIGIVPGPELDQFSDKSRFDLTNRDHIISNKSNRMGYRLEGTLAGYQALPEMISSGVVPGAIQVTKSGQLIVLMADAQTTGGYHRIATVCHGDLSRLAQMKPGDDLCFRWIK